MKHKLDDKKNVEDFFCDDFLSEKLINGESLEGELSEDDIRFSKGLLDAVNSKREAFSAGDKDFLAARITESIEKSKKRNSFKWIGYAASLIILVGLVYIILLTIKMIYLDLPLPLKSMKVCHQHNFCFQERKL